MEANATGQSEQLKLQSTPLIEILYHLHAILLLSESMYGFYQLIKNKESKLLRGPQLVVKGVYFSVWLIYGILAKEGTYAFPGYVGIALLQMLVYLVIVKQWEYIVYYFTIVINTSWYMRQTTMDDLELGCNLAAALVMVAPVYNLIQAVRSNDLSFLSTFMLKISGVEAIVFFAFAFTKENIYIQIAAAIKLLLILGSTYAFIHITTKKLLEKNSDKKVN